MAYDEALAARIRELIGDRPDLGEAKVFGGLAFLINGNMAVAASSNGGLVVRVEREEGERLVETTDARPMEMRGKTMHGWIRVDAEHVESDNALERWVATGVGYASSLPPKQKN